MSIKPKPKQRPVNMMLDEALIKQVDAARARLGLTRVKLVTAILSEYFSREAKLTS